MNVSGGDAVRRYVDEAERENAALLAGRPALAANLGGEMRCLRAIGHVVIGEMTERLRR